jgi:hypothetical protein
MQKDSLKSTHKKDNHEIATADPDFGFGFNI